MGDLLYIGYKNGFITTFNHEQNKIRTIYIDSKIPQKDFKIR